MAASSVVDERVGAEVVHGAEECEKKLVEILEELGFPKGVLPLEDLEEFGRNRETGFVWVKQRTSRERLLERKGTRLIYAPEVTTYVEPGKMKRVTGVRSRHMVLWYPIAEMRVEEGVGARGKKIMFYSTLVGFHRTYQVSDFMTEEESKIEGM